MSEPAREEPKVTRLPDDPRLTPEHARRRARATRYGGVAPKERSLMSTTATPKKRTAKGKVDENVTQEPKAPKRKERVLEVVMAALQTRPQYRDGELSMLQLDGEVLKGSDFGSIKPGLGEVHVRIRPSELAAIFEIDEKKIGRENDTPGTVWCESPTVAQKLAEDRDALRERLAEEKKAMRAAEKEEDAAAESEAA